MKKIFGFCFLVILIISTASNAQSHEEKIYTTLNNYIEGTSYNDQEQIRKAFYKDADLFLDKKDKSLWVVSNSEYISLFNPEKKGIFNGRIGRIMSVERFGNIATAKVEILIPNAELRFIDLFILKEIEGSWKIISKTATSKTSNRKGKRILFITSNAKFYGDSDISTGNSYSEIVNAYDTFDKAGFTVDFVSPAGGTIPLSYINTSNELQIQYLFDTDFMYNLKHTKSAQQIDSSLYEAIYYVGGGSAMYQVPENEDIQNLVMSIYTDGGILSSVCHGTAGIVNLKTENGEYLVKGKRINGYPDDYENTEGEYYKHFPFLIKKTIEERGGTFKFSEKGTPHLEVDGRIVTGQNHLSAKLVAEQIVEMLSK